QVACRREIEKKLIGLQPPHEVYYEYDVDYHGDPDDPQGDHDYYCIGIAKSAGKWRLCRGEFNQRDRWECNQRGYHDFPISWFPITDSTKEERIALAQHVSKLEQKIVETGEEMLPKI